MEALDVPDSLFDAADSAGAAVLAALLQGHRRMLVRMEYPELNPVNSGGSGFGGGPAADAYAETLAQVILFNSFILFDSFIALFLILNHSNN